MNCKNYQAYVNNKKKQEENILIISAENLQEVKQLLETRRFDVERFDKLNFVTSNGDVLVSFDVRGIKLVW